MPRVPTDPNLAVVPTGAQARGSANVFQRARAPVSGVPGRALQQLGGAIATEGKRISKDDEAAARAEAKASLQLQDRREAVTRADILNGHSTAAGNLLRNSLSQKDLSKDEDMIAFGLELNDLRTQARGSFQGSELGGLILEERLAEAEGKFVAEAVKQAALIEQAKVEKVLGDNLNLARNEVSFRPEILDEQIQKELKRAREDFGFFDPTEELAFESIIPATLANAAISSHIISGKFGKAEALLTRPDLAAALGEKRTLQLSEQIQESKTALDKARAEARTRDVKGVPRDVFDALPSEERQRLLGTEEPIEGEILNEEETAKAGFESGTVVQQKPDGTFDVLQEPGTDLAETEAIAQAKERGTLTARAENTASILRAAGVPPLAGVIAPFGEKEPASDDVQSVAQLLRGASALIAGGQTQLANSLLSQARFLANNSSDIRTQRELDKPISTELAREFGVPVGTTMREVTSLIPESPEERAGDLAEASAAGRQRVESRQQLAFVSEARDTITDFLDAIEDDPGLVGIRGSLRSTGQAAIGVLHDLGLTGITDTARSIALTDSDLGTEGFEDLFDNPKLSVLKVFENSVGLILARIRNPTGRLQVAVINLSIEDVKLSGLTSTERVVNRLNFVLNVLAARERNLRGSFKEEEEEEEEDPANAPTHHIIDGKLEKISEEESEKEPEEKELKTELKKPKIFKPEQARAPTLKSLVIPEREEESPTKKLQRQLKLGLPSGSKK